MANNECITCKNMPEGEKKPVTAKELTLEQRNEDEKFMARCLQLACQGLAGARPNPMVGAVVVHEGKIIGEGYHICQGGPHAEVNAIASVKQTELLTESTIYVSLEPCAHYGKTPPCADLIISKGIKRCVIGCKDPFAKVDGLGIKKLLDAGVEVVVGIREQECLELNRTFITYHMLKRPYITLKWAQSSDGMIDAKRTDSKGLKNPGKGEPVKFSTPLSMALMHRRRALSDAILVGGGTALSDNPSLTIRHWAGRGETGNLPTFIREKQGNVKGNPLRIVIDTKGNLPHSLNIFNKEAETLVWGNWDLKALMGELYQRNIQTLLVEGGAETLKRFLEADLWDEIRVETAPFTLEEGVKAPSLDGMLPCETLQVGGNTISRYLR